MKKPNFWAVKMQVNGPKVIIEIERSAHAVAITTDNHTAIKGPVDVCIFQAERLSSEKKEV